MLTRLARYVRDHHIGLLALVVAMTGTAYAASLPRNSVGTAQLKNRAVTNKKIRNNAVTSSKVKNGSLLRADFKRGQLPTGRGGSRGPRGLRGLRGLRGSRGPAGVVGNVVVRRLDVALPDNSTASGSATCAGGEKIVGGGVNISASGSQDVNITVSRPSQGTGQGLPSSGQAFDRWRGAAANPAGGTGGTTMRVWAVCTPGSQQSVPSGGGGD